MKVNKRSIYAIGLAVTCLGFASTDESAKAQLSKFSGINTDNTMNPQTMKNITHLMSRQTSVQISVDANSVSGIAAGGTYRIAGDNLATATLPTITAAGLVNGTGLERQTQPDSRELIGNILYKHNKPMLLIPLD